MVGRAGGPARGCDARAAGASSAGSPNVAVFVVGGDPSIRLVAARVLTRAGLEVRTYATAGAALPAIEADGPIEMLLTDVAMPGELDGIALAEQLAERHPETMIVLMSGDAGSLVRGGELSGVSATLSKPFTLRELDDLDAALGCRRIR